MARLLALAAAMAALGACGDDPADSARVQRLESELALTVERAAGLERRLAQAQSEAGAVAALREELGASQARVAELETPAGIAAVNRGEDGRDETRRRLVEVAAALREADRALGAMTPPAAAAPGADVEADPEVVSARADVARAAEALTAVAETLGLEITGLAR